MFSYPSNLYNSLLCDADYKVFLLDTSLAKEIRQLRPNSDNINFKELGLHKYLSKFTSLKDIYIRLITAIRNPVTTTNSLCNLLLELINIFCKYHMQAHDCLFLQTYLIEFCMDARYVERAEIAKNIYLSEPRNLRALYLYYFFSQVGKNYRYALVNRYRLYERLVIESKLHNNSICLSPLIGVSIGHYYLLMQAICTEISDVSVKIFASPYGIGAEIRKIINTIPAIKLESFNCYDNLSISILAEAYHSDIVAYSYCIKIKPEQFRSFTLGINYIALHFRTEGYKNQGGYWNILRNATPFNFELLGQFIASNDSFVSLKRIFCIGDSAACNSHWSPHVVSDEESAVEQWDIMMNSRLFIGCNSGISALAPFLSKSVLIVNATSLWSVVAVTTNVIFALKFIQGLKSSLKPMTRDTFLCLLYLDWVGNEGLCTFFEIQELSQYQLLAAYVQVTTSQTQAFSDVCKELEVIPFDIPERYLTKDCVENIKNIALSLPLGDSRCTNLKLTKVMWQ